jgi:hypothetical protein
MARLLTPRSLLPSHWRVATNAAIRRRSDPATANHARVMTTRRTAALEDPGAVR